MGYFGIFLLFWGIVTFRTSRRRRKEKPDNYVKVPPWLDFILVQEWITMILGVMMIFADFVFHAF